MAIPKKKKKIEKPIKKSKKDQQGTIDLMVDEIEKEAKAPIKPKKENTKLLRAKTGSTLLDLLGAFVFGKIVNLVGDNSTGKTILAIECIVQTFFWFLKNMKGFKLKMKYDDAEAGFSFDPKTMYDIDDKHKELLSVFDEENEASETVEDFEYNLEKEMNNLKDNEYLIYVLDSLDALSSKEEKKRGDQRMKAMASKKAGGKEEKVAGTYGMEKQKKLGELFRRLRLKIKKKRCLLIVISQVRENIGIMFGEKYKRMGGKALDFYAAVIWWLAVLDKNMKHGISTGVTIKAKNKKNKVGKPYRIANINVLFDYGIDDISSNIEYLYELRDEKGKLNKDKIIKWNKKEYTIKSLIRHIEKNNLEDELKEKVIQKWIDFEDSISTKRKRKFE